ncbi:G-D-S-L family lipolytic protein [Halosimplex carlsbadense 2-9-1]|uniref:G-D-S-L family lipolytic protein n=1 Tax=Halosimplex carlsbadense 2-9-1 TaxID=797114 RepID=M0D2D6_9EURY|nr:GDSL-type esterase/lipase family protein [Halosimplex carlsbadense]ELZ29681.1 G-D-S-L family lipolytic protein [Halosimplex carlsbadense 2-9-1]
MPTIDEYPSVSLHNVSETVPADWADDGDRLHRLPADVAGQLNEMADGRVREPTGSELRFVPETDDAEIEVTLSAEAAGELHVFWGGFQPWKPTDIGPEPTTLTLSVPERLRKLDTDVDGRYDPRVCRICFERTPAVAVHDVTGDCRPPEPAELPDTRYLAYGTSITEGAAASADHLNYVSRAARELGWDALNFGCSGSAYADAPMGEYIADRDDWDVATLALSINMANQEFPVEEFEEKARGFVETIAEAHQDEPIACITLFPYYPDVIAGGDAERAEDYRETLRAVVADTDHPDISVIEGRELTDVSGYTADILHPGDAGMETIGRNLADELDDRIE